MGSRLKRCRRESNLTDGVHQLVDDDAKVDASRPERDGLNPAGPADAAAAPVAGDDVDVASLRRSRGEPGKH